MPDRSSDRDVFLLDSYNYDLPPGLIAQYPVVPRDSSRLLVMEKDSGRLRDRHFNDVVDFFEAGDTLVLNETRVIPARLWGIKDTGAKIELLLLKQVGDNWEALVKPARRMKIGAIVRFPGTAVWAEVKDVLEGDGCRLIRFNNCPHLDVFLNQSGQVPLPPYVDRKAEPEDQIRYQTVYAKKPGSAAAPTAGLHFTTQLIDRIRAKGVNVATIVLHVGLGTFRPVTRENIREHHMHYEHFQVSPDTAAILNDTRRRKSSIIAVGTTVVRALESVYDDELGFTSQESDTNIFIYPGYRFKAIDKLITNFHLPGSSLLMLVAGLAGFDNTMEAYRHAVNLQYRFFSYGDAMLII